MFLSLNYLFSALVLIFSQPSAFISTGLDFGMIGMEANDLLEQKQLLEDHLLGLYNGMNLSELGLNYMVFQSAMVGYYNLAANGRLVNTEIVSIVDFSQPSTEKRFYTIDLKNEKILYNTLVAHGRKSGDDIASSFSNEPESNKSSLGFYVTGQTYQGENGYSMLLEGIENGINHNARQRSIVVHKADYVSEEFIRDNGRLGRSLGCPALPVKMNDRIIDDIKNGSCLFIYGNDKTYSSKSAYLNTEVAAKTFAYAN